MANTIVLNSSKGDSIALTGVTSVYNQPNAFAQIGVTVYSTASIAANAGNALAGKALAISGFAAAGNNGTFLVLGSTATTITTNNANGVLVTAAATASFAAQGSPAQYASKIENRWSNQNGENASVSANTGDLLVAIAIGMKSYQPFDLLHGSSTAPGYLQGLNDFNALPTIDDTSTGGASATVTAVAIAKNNFVLSAVNKIASITATAAAVQAATITNLALTSNVVTITATNTFKVGETVVLAGLTTTAALNGTVLTVATAPGTTFTAALTHANISTAAETGTATGNLLTVTATNTLAAGQSVFISGTEEAVLNGTVLTVLAPSGSAFFANTTLPSFSNASDTGSAAQISTNGSAIYTGTLTGGGSNAFAGFYFTTSGFAHSQNNGTFLCTASSATTLTLSNAAGFGELAVAAASDYVLTLTASNSFTTTGGQTVQLASFVNAPFLNGQLVKIVAATGSAFTANYGAYVENYTGTETAATASLPGGNVWSLAASLSIADSDPTNPSYTTSSQWNLDQYYPSIYIWVAQNAVAGSYKVNLNSMYQLGIDEPQEYAAGSIPIFDGGVNFQVFSISGALTTGQPQAFSISSGFPAETVANPATAPGTLTLTGGDGGALLSVGIMKSGNVFAAGSIGGTATSLTLTAVAPLLYGTGTQYPPQNYGGSVYTGTITGGAANALVGNVFTVTGFVNAGNNGVFTCTASTATTLTLSNGVSVAETHAGAAAYTPLMLQIGNGKLVGSEAHYIVEFQTVAAGTYNPGFNNPLGYPVLVGSIAIQSL